MIGPVHSATSQLQPLIETIARSQIVVSQPVPVRDFADWCERQRPADIDDVILAWLRVQAQTAPRAYS
jgi:hypothetical protein